MKKAAKCGVKARKRGKLLRGFTLWELMIAAAVSVLAIGAILVTFIACVSLNEANDNLVTAAADAQSVMEDAAAISFSALDASYSPVQHTNLENENTVFSVNQISSNVKEVTVNVSWTEKGRARNFILSTRIAP